MSGFLKKTNSKLSVEVFLVNSFVLTKNGVAFFNLFRILGIFLVFVIFVEYNKCLIVINCEYENGGCIFS